MFVEFLRIRLGQEERSVSNKRPVTDKRPKVNKRPVR